MIKVRLSAKRFFEQWFRFVELSQRKVDASELLHDVQVIRTQTMQSFERRHRFLDLAQAQMRQPKIIERSGILRMKFQRSAK